MIVRKSKDGVFDSGCVGFEWVDNRTNEKNYWTFIKAVVDFIGKHGSIRGINTYGEMEPDYTIDEHHYFESADDFAKRNEVAKEDAQTIKISFDFEGEHINMTAYVNNAKFGEAILYCFMRNEDVGDKFSDLLLKRFK